MRTFLKRYALLFSVCITGASVLVIEVVAVRVLSPYYGNTMFTVSSVISVILAGLSIGYVAGGRLADRQPSLRRFFGLILAGGCAVLALHTLGVLLLPFLGAGLSLSLGPLVSSLVLFFVPAVILGTLSPYAVALQKIQNPEHGIGSVAGDIFFWSTLGSIAGSLAAGFLLIPRIGIDRIVIGTGGVLCVLGLIPLVLLRAPSAQLLRGFIATLALTQVAFSAVREMRGEMVYSADGRYEKIAIYDGVFKERPTRFFQQDRSSSGAMFLDSDDPTDLPYAYTSYYALYKQFVPDVRTALVIGGGAYSIPKALLAELPHALIDVAEIEPGLPELAREYFSVPENTRLRTIQEDGRRLLRDSPTGYDLIFSDVYYSLASVPPHFTTQEFFEVAKKRLNTDGLFIANLVGNLSPEHPSFIMAELKTFRSVFSNSYFFAVESPSQIQPQNLIFVGYNSPRRVAVSAPFREKQIDVGGFDFASHPLLTDNFSPTEYFTAHMLRRTLR